MEVTKMPLKIPNVTSFEDPEEQEEEIDFEEEEIDFEEEEIDFEEEEIDFEEEEIDFEEEKEYWIKLRSMLLYKRVLILRKVTRKRGYFITSIIFHLTMKDYTQPVNLLLNNCVAGHLATAIAVQEAIQGMPTDINTIVCGMTASVGSFVLLSGDMRLAEPRARVLIQRPKFRMKRKKKKRREFRKFGRRKSMDALRRIEDYICKIYVEKTGQSYDIIQQDLKRTRLMSAKEAQHYGIIDRIMTVDNILLPEENLVPVGIEFTSLFIN
jgi:ATP-dependent Clp protease protease subunit